MEKHSTKDVRKNIVDITEFYGDISYMSSRILKVVVDEGRPLKVVFPRHFTNLEYYIPQEKSFLLLSSYGDCDLTGFLRDCEAAKIFGDFFSATGLGCERRIAGDLRVEVTIYPDPDINYPGLVNALVSEVSQDRMKWQMTELAFPETSTLLEFESTNSPIVVKKFGFNSERYRGLPKVYYKGANIGSNQQVQALFDLLISRDVLSLTNAVSGYSFSSGLKQRAGEKDVLYL